MFFSIKGFSILELLVTVCIIGILASVAFVQYPKAVERSRVAGVLPTIKTFQQALDVYMLSAYDGKVSLLGDEAGQGGILPVQFNCVMEENGESRCYVDDFGYRVWCSDVGCFVSVTREDNPKMNEDHYGLLSRKLHTPWNDYPVGVWENMCMAHTDKGYDVCIFLQKQGWQINDERYVSRS